MNIDLKNNTLKYYICLLIIVLIGVALRIYFFSGYYGLDDAEYSRISHQIADGSYTFGEYDGPETFMLRMGLNFPSAISFYLFGVNEWSIVLYPFALSILNILLIYVFAVHLFGHRAGLMASLIWTILPIDVCANATRLVPDAMSAFYASLGVVLILLTSDSRTKRNSCILPMGILAGLSFGLSWLCKESVAYLFPFCIAFMIITLKNDFKKNIVLWAGVAIGSLGVLVGEMITYYNLSGDLLFRVHATEKMYGDQNDGLFSEGSRWGWAEGGSYIKGVIKRISITGPKMILLNINYLYLPLIGLIASLYALYWRERAFLIPALWLTIMVFMFNFASSSLESYTPLALLHRYLYPLFFPAIVLTGGFLEILLFNKKENGVNKGEKSESFFWGVILVVFLCVTGVWQIFGSAKYQSKGWAPEGRIVSTILNPSDRIYTDILNIKSLEFFWRYPEKMETIDFEGMHLANEIIPGSFVLLHPTAVKWLKLNEGMWLNKGPVYDTPGFYENVPQSWETVWKNGNATLYKVE